ncbi:hypothetical protein [Saccharothrix coeruleofusca]|uniref:Uncharacterized protein n=1 Tax=Saccharothrix coeruleofusca TaxID=33919 RepID=A0A918EB91_9PSEU|nr:hypothetical protein [Saccharothrix coeruleofusca]GGP34176.1 hypothetical protein GCM10010185_00840 [Saccharothrix coeruleofusca]
MTDLDLPPGSPLPDGVRDAALTRLRAGFDAPPPRRLPLKVAAVAVAVAATTALAVQLVDRDGTASTAASRADIPELALSDAGSDYDLRTGSVPEGAARRCHAGGTGLPPVEGWTPVATASRHGVDVMAFGTGAGTVFCETTPASVTVSPPVADPGALTLAFTTSTGSLAGFTGDDPRPFTLAGDRAADRRAVAARSGRIFLVPNGFLPTGPVVAQPEVTGAADLVQRFELATPPPSPAVVDRPRAPEERDSAEGRRLGECLDGRPVPDPAAWRAGQAVALGAAESAQLGHYGDLLLLCHQDRTVQVHDLGRKPQVSGATLRGVRVFHGFVDSRDESGTAYTSSNTVAVIAVPTDPRVASVTVEGPDDADVTAAPVAGSVVLPGITLNEAGSTVVRLVVRDASGAVLEEVRQEL